MLFCIQKSKNSRAFPIGLTQTINVAGETIVLDRSRHKAASASGLLVSAGSYVAYWHFSDLTLAFGDVCSSG